MAGFSGSSRQSAWPLRVNIQSPHRPERNKATSQGGLNSLEEEIVDQVWKMYARKIIASLQNTISLMIVTVRKKK